MSELDHLLLLNSALFTPDYFRQDVCRLCWSKNAGNELYHKIHNSMYAGIVVKDALIVQIQNCIGIDLTQDDLDYYPKKLCETCTHKIEQFNEFKVFCQNSNEKLNIILNRCESKSPIHIAALLKEGVIKLENEENSFDSIDPVCDDDLDSFTESSQHSKSSPISIEKAPHENRKRTIKPITLEEQQQENSGLEINKLPGDSKNDVEFLKSNSNSTEDDKVLNTKTIKVNKKSELSVVSNNSEFIKNSYLCKICSQDFEDEEALLSHKSKAHGILKYSKYKCYGCHKSYGNRKSIHSHEVYWCKNLDDGYKCNICNRFLPTRITYERHVRDHRHNIVIDMPEDTSGIFKCSKCNDQFIKRSLWRKHMSEHTPKNNYVCEGHPLSEDRAVNLLSNHLQESVVASPHSPPQEDPPTEHDVEAVSATSDEQKTKTLKEQQYTKSGTETNNSPSDSKQTTLNKTNNIEVNQKSELRMVFKNGKFEKHSYLCKICFQDFKDEEVLSSHKSEAHGILRDGTYKCFSCDKTYRNRKTRLSHEVYFCKSLEDGYKCNICNRFLPTRSSYERHLRDHRFNKVVDTPEDTSSIFKCGKCNEKFAKRSLWKKHMTVHAPKNNYVCETRTLKKQRHRKSRLETNNSPGDFKKNSIESLKSNLISTKDDKVLNTKNITYLCKICSQDFNDEEALLTHKSEVHGILKDGTYKCFGCDKTYGNRKSLHSHEVYLCKNLEYGYKCNICNRFLPTRSTFERHVRDHRLNSVIDMPEDTSGIFKCNKCSDQFTKRSLWKEHMILHAKIKYIPETTTLKEQQHIKSGLETNNSLGVSKKNCVEFLKSNLNSTKDDEVLNTRNITYLCKICCYDCNDEEALLTHKSEVHGILKDGTYKCFGCDKTYGNRKSLHSHEVYLCKNLEDGYKCNICNRFLPTRTTFVRHMRDHRLNKVIDMPEDTSGIFKCNKCGEQFTLRSLWKEHMIIHAVNIKYIRETRTLKEQQHTKSEALGIQADGTYKCFGCVKTYRRRHSRLTHEVYLCKNLEDGYKCDICNRFFPKRIIFERHMRDHRLNTVIDMPEDTSGIFKCDKCKEQFTKRSLWRKHLIVHDPKKNSKYVCETCGKLFSRLAYLRSHNNIHTGRRRYGCPHCSYRSVQKQVIQIHLRIHTKERPYACDMCPQRCISKSNLEVHRRRHLGLNKAFQCSICNKKFGYKDSLKNHLLYTHEKFQAFKCSLCGAAFARKGGLRRHWRSKHPAEFSKPETKMDIDNANVI